MERDTKLPNVEATRLLGVNLRNGRHALDKGEGDRVFGLYPKQNGQLSRIPGKLIYRYLQGRAIYNFCQTFGGAGQIIVQNGDRVDVYTLDDFLNRHTTTSIVQVIPNEEDFGRAIIIQSEGNTINGGSAQGYQTGSNDTTSASDTFYGRRLTSMPVNETVGGLLTVNTFTASTGGGTAASTAGTFALVAGNYDIEINAVYTSVNVNNNIIWGLYDNTNAVFATHTGTTNPILGTVHGTTNFIGSFVHTLRGNITPTATVTYKIMHKADNITEARNDLMCGNPTTMTGANVNAAAAKNLYCVIRITRYS